MADIQNFRSAFNGFNREDVVQYIEYINNRYNAQLNQLRNELQAAQNVPSGNPGQEEVLRQQLAEAQAKCSALEQELSETKCRLEQALAQRNTANTQAEEELAAYRRAERVERLAQERAAQMSAQVKDVIAEAAAKIDEAAALVENEAKRTSAQIVELQEALTAGKAVLQNASEAVSAVQSAEVD